MLYISTVAKNHTVKLELSLPLLMETLLGFARFVLLPDFLYGVARGTVVKIVDLFAHGVRSFGERL
jgi:hypothetical protein